MKTRIPRKLKKKLDKMFSGKIKSPVASVTTEDDLANMTPNQLFDFFMKQEHTVYTSKRPLESYRMIFLDDVKAEADAQVFERLQKQEMSLEEIKEKYPEYAPEVNNSLGNS